MFGIFKNRKKYNGAVDAKLNNEYQIETRENEFFPGINAYLQLLDTASNAQMNEDEAAMYVASLYAAGLKKHGFYDIAWPVVERLIAVGRFGVERGMIRVALADSFMNAVDSARPDLQPTPAPAQKEDLPAPKVPVGTEDWRDLPAIFRK